MSRYIDRDAFINQQRELYCKNCARRMGVKNGKLKEIYKIGEAACKSCELNDALDDLDDYPEADVAPVVHAHWIDILTGVVCSSCHRFWLKLGNLESAYKSPYCRYCGAKMYEEVKKDGTV